MNKTSESFNTVSEFGSDDFFKVLVRPSLDLSSGLNELSF